MSKRNRIIREVGSEPAESTSETAQLPSDKTEQQAAIDEQEHENISYADDETISHARLSWLIPALAICAVIAWTGFYTWAISDQLIAAAQLPPSQWTGWIIDWSVPVLLLGVIWLIIMRNSHREAKRFAHTAALLSQESAQLENRLNIINRELSVAREFLATQSLELESLGRVASEKLSNHACELQDLIKDNGDQIDRIESTSKTALANMNQLRDDLPVVANSARDVSNKVGNAGRTAHEQLENLITGFERLNEFGNASENQVKSFQQRIGHALSSFETELGQIEDIVSGRFDTLQAQAKAYNEEINAAEGKALGALKDRIMALQNEAKAVSVQLHDAEAEALNEFHAAKDRSLDEITQLKEKLDELDQAAKSDAKSRMEELYKEAERFDDILAKRDLRFVEEIERRQADFDTREAQSSEILAQRLAQLDEAIAERREAQIADTQKLVEHSQDISTQLEKMTALLRDVNDNSQSARETLSESLDELGQDLSEKRAAMAETEKELAALTDTAVRLLEIIQSGAKHTREDLPEAIAIASQDLEAVEDRAQALNASVLQAGGNGKDLSEYLIKAHDQLHETDALIDALQTKLGLQTDDTLAKLQGLRTGLSRLASEGQEFENRTQTALLQSLEQLEAATQSAFHVLEEGAREKVSALADSLSQDAIEALERSLKNQSAQTIGKLEQAASHASGVGREVTAQLRDQLTKVNELTGNLEQRITEARARAEEQLDNDFTRRMALITDSLNSSAIDISSALSKDVTDTAWDAYLKGDRGIFTRRAVRLLENGEAREIADLYQNDDVFKANVARYIHDFEKMLRSMLSTRDGNALSVTMLGSDMGKLYVMLAQAIARFRN